MTPFALGAGLVLLRPLWLLALLPLAALAVWLRAQRGRSPWTTLIDPAIRRELLALGQILPARADRAALLPLLIAGTLILGLAGPAVLRPGGVEYRALDPMLLLLDLSPSVAAGPALPDLQAAAAFLLNQSEGRPVGIMVYAADAYIASAPTSDAASLQSIIAVLAADTMPVTGSRPDIALAESRNLVAGKDGPGIAGADLVLISDGGGVGPPALTEARRLQAEGARVWALSLPRAAEGAPTPDRGALVQLAAAGGGKEFPAATPRPLLAEIAAARTARLARSGEATRVFRDLGPWCVGLAMLLALPLYRRRA
ncbi:MULTISPECIES: VWA domain-containing protein [Haematobacter]|uniref:VWFA domain-containing protein n=1 Tax=Haematobacter genomosp. 1 TaxID=366618 RepID=A0A212AFM2_9RHOB|nr:MULTISPECIES: VWA domain-containing protein [Haematobacter]OWJ80275.1 hypothetical protein CDV49_03080 [Haematobacter genomosp. 1]